LAGSGAPTVVTAVPEPLTVTAIVRPSKLETPHPATLLCTRKQYGPVVLKLPEFPPVAMAVQLPAEPELLLDELEDEELELLLEDDELELLLEEDELELLLEEDELEELLPPTVTVKSCMVWAPQLLVYVAVAVQEAVIVTVCSRAVPEVPHPVQLQEPPVVGCGPNWTESPAVMPTLAVCCQVPPLTRRYGTTLVGVHPPLEELLDEELLLEDELDELLLEDELEPPPTT
jgi:hypothetical protein